MEEAEEEEDEVALAQPKLGFQWVTRKTGWFLEMGFCKDPEDLEMAKRGSLAVDSMS